ncbi:MAG: Gfo/Idh/MocA family oxidoreductase [Armatimonadetes bacterium]|nr:Gfo/Idh/MocA family oxidoreductase [Armatimonadota bacterium]
MSDTPLITHAIIGCGRIAANHADAFQNAEGARLAAVVDVDESAARAIAQAFGVERVHTSIDDVLRDPTITSVSLCTPHDLHAPMALDAIAAGKHVLVEKPVAIDPEDGRRVRDAAERSGLVVMPVVQHRFDPAIIAIGDMIAEGGLGRIVMLRAHLECLRAPEYYRDSPWRGTWAHEGGSVLINQAWHIVDLLSWLGGGVRTVTAQKANQASAEVMETEDTLVATLTFSGGALGALTVNGAAASQWNSFIEVCGTDGVVAFDINYPNTVPRLQLKSKRAMQQLRRRLEAAQQTTPEAPPGLAYYGVSHRDQARAFVDRVLGRPTPHAADLAHSLHVLDVVHAMYASSTDARPITVGKELAATC